ncbi:hypothetical protein Hte_000008 [Hypoxylon texense]
MALVGSPRGLRPFILPVGLVAIALVLVALYHGVVNSEGLLESLPIINNGRPHQVAAQENRRPTNTHAPPKYKPTPTLTVPPVTDPFPLLAKSTAAPPPIPQYNVPRPGLHRQYGLSYAPPLFIGFTRQYSMLLQCVVSYLTAGWPPESIFIVENTGVQNSNAEGRLSLQNPFYLNYGSLRRLGVNIIQTPALLTFSQMQNFFLSTARARSWPYYFYSHQDVVVFSFEDGPDTMKRPGDRDWFFYDEQDEIDTRPAAAGEPTYRTIYENCLYELNQTLGREERWAFRWFQYDHLTLVNRAALEAVGGWDALIPYYGSDCDLNARLEMDGWTMRHRRVGIINDVSTVMEDLLALYRDPSVTPRFVDPNPIESAEAEEKEQAKEAQSDSTKEDDQGDHKNEVAEKRDEQAKGRRELAYFRELVRVADEMGAYKYRDENKNRNSWQNSQQGGVGEPYFYNGNGFNTAFWILAEAGREIFRQKWGHRDCDLVKETALKLEDQWLVEKDWE